jgi:hypothetical protein
MLAGGDPGTEDHRMPLDQVVSQSADTFTIAGGPRSITLVPTFQQGYVPNVIDGFRFTLRVTGAAQMPTKIFRYRLVPTKVQASITTPPTAIELMGAFDGVCSPADLEDFPEDWPAQNARPPWYRLDYVDLIVRSRAISNAAYSAIMFEIERLVDTLNTMDRQVAAPPITIGPEL